ncbi:thermonuclease family protein [Kytococcus sedentarius]|uniref:thermonuclease family protein n=1 Tax=Kytococcus sedentarius TaxID=1276 RepID=UPI00194DC32D|nr:thermonuclease family protein [Kytococcus sedentarius]QRO86512.1 thermonuclease family protein [Kytococcus sedentarius]
MGALTACDDGPAEEAVAAPESVASSTTAATTEAPESSRSASQASSATTTDQATTDTPSATTSSAATSASPSTSSKAAEQKASPTSTRASASATPSVTSTAPSKAATPSPASTPAPKTPKATPSQTKTATKLPAKDKAKAKATATSDGAAKAAAAGAAAAAVGTASGPVVKIVDGDTIDVRLSSGVERIRIIGLDTPERGECGFSEASAAMADLVAGRSVQLVRDPTQDNRDRYGRLVRHVHRGNTSAAVEMIRRGHSAEYLYGTEYQNRSAHLRAEREARAAKVGMWSARGCATPTPTPSPTPTEPVTVVAPPEPTPTAPTGSCRIKGNISSSGEKIFHSPGQAHYERTKISLDKGERWFCSAADAVKAGWRAAKQ